MSSICIFGAGSVGCYLGGWLAAAGSEVCLIGRERIAQELREYGLTVSDLEGRRERLPRESLHFTTDAAAVADAALVLVTVKSAATDEAGRTLAVHLRPGTVVISFQNGLGNAERLRQALPQHTVLTGIVPFNVVHHGRGIFHRGSEGDLEVQRHPDLEPFRAAFTAAGLTLLLHDDMEPLLWAKLLLNLNNAINALSDLPLKTELSQRDYRRCLALAQHEALDLLDVAGIRPARLTPLPPHWLPRLLNVPDALFRRLANRMLAMDPFARSSMWEDLKAGRVTEVDWLNGEVLKLAARLGKPAPVNARLVELVREAEQGGRRDWSGAELLVQLREAARAG